MRTSHSILSRGATEPSELQTVEQHGRAGVKAEEERGKLLEASTVCELFLRVVAPILALILGQVKLKEAE